MQPIPATSPEGLLDISSAPIGFGYYKQDAGKTETAPTARVGWWTRHRRLAIGVGMTLVTALGFVPAVQYAVLLVQA
ncbi:hypothetical protein OG203_09145 [Nocardia sp. NBC_01499]|uniref:hypothetical protein n=1 Tax=Nocardia sp. NBC_01499 TaxID=2903597 RepID=UPI00386B35EA